MSSMLRAVSADPASMLRLTPIAFTIRMAFAGLLVSGLIPGASAQTAVVEEVAPLPVVKVSADRSGELPQPYAGGQVARGARLGLLGNTSVLDAPFNVTSYTAESIQNQQAGNIADVLARDPSVRSTGQGAGIGDAFFIRGFPIGEGNAGEIAFDGQYGIAPNYRVFADYVERVEVIKGPAALLYGMSPNSGVGGVINVVPKRAGATDLTRATLDYASDSEIGEHLDISRRFGTERQFGVRFNGSHHQGDTPLDKQSRKADIGALALDYQGERFRATLDVLGQREKFDAPSRPFLAAAGIAVPSAPDGRRNVTQSWEWSKVEDQSVLLRTEYDVNDQLTLFANAGGANTEVSRLFGTPTITNAAGDTQNTPAYFKFDVDRTTSDVGLRTRFNTAAVRHTVTLQASAYSDRLNRGSRNGAAVFSNIYAPGSSPVQDVAAPAQVPEISETKLSGVALTDSLSMLDDRVLVTLGARHQNVESDNFNPATGARTSSYDKSAVTPLAGLVYKPWQHVSLYTNYIEGLSKGDVAPPTASNAGEVFAPYKSKQHEIGVKIDHGRMITTVSLFQVKKPGGQLAGGIYAIDGEQRNRGLEVSLTGEVMSGLRLLSGVTLIDAELTKTNSAATRGNKPTGVPTVQANLGVEWDSSWLSGLTLTGGVAYTGKQYINNTNTQEIPDWTRVDLGARYTTRIAGKSTTFRADVLNAFDRDYWSGVASWGGFVQGAPRTVLLSASVDF